MVTKEEKKRDKFPIFQKRFNELRGKMSQDDFAKFIGISRPTIGFYENGERVPDALVLNKIADACEVDIDYLLGRSDVKRGSADDRVLQKRFGFSDNTIKEFDNLVTGKSQAELAIIEHNPLYFEQMGQKPGKTKDYIGFLNLLFQHEFSEVIRTLHDAYMNYKEDVVEEAEYYEGREEFDIIIRREVQKARLNMLPSVTDFKRIGGFDGDYEDEFDAMQPMRMAYFDAEGSLEFMLNMVKKHLDKMIREMEEDNDK